MSDQLPLTAPPPKAPVLPPQAPAPAASPPPATPAETPRMSVAEAFRKGMAGTPEPEKPEARPAPDKPAESKKAPDATPDKPADDADMPAEIRSDEGRKSWRTWKELHGKVLAERDSLKAEVEKVRKETAGFEKLRKEHEQLDQIVRRVQIEKHPNFVAKFEAPVRDALDRVGRIVPADKKEAAIRLLSQPASEARTTALEEIAQELRPFASYQLMQAAADIDSTLASREKALVEENGIKTRLEEEEKSARTARQEAEAARCDEIFRDVLKVAQKAEGGLPIFIPREGDDAHNKAIEERIGKARQLLLGNNKPEEIAQAAFWAVYGQESVGLLREAQEEIARLQKNVDSLSGRTPRMGGSNGSSQSGSGGGDGDRKTFLQSIREQMNTAT